MIRTVFTTPGPGTVRAQHTGTSMADFTREEIEALYKVMAARRDMRHFSSEPLPARVAAATS